MNCKNAYNYTNKDCWAVNKKEGKCSDKKGRDSCHTKKCNDRPTSFCQSFEKDGSIITDNEYEIKSEESIVEIE